MTETVERAQVLWKNYKTTRSLEARNELVLQYVHLVKSIVCRMVPTYRKHVDFDDLMSCGIIGLMDAIDKFDPSKDVKFETYASMRIRGEIIDQIRKQDWAPISLRQKIKRVEDGYHTLEGRLGRSVTEREVAEFIHMEESSVKKTLEEAHTFNLVCLDEVLVDRLKSEEMAINNEETPEGRVEAEELKRILADYVDRLPEKERLVVTLYYFEELTLKEIGLALGVSESRVSQIHSKALMGLRNRIQQAFAI
ncbi:MAG: FliA/WhiG family RNA polymerase sigma factor [Oscillospiraceae bacterium]|jgi:RNA polymerase sigma factor for flagellar operon FliA|nr:FliA/WhiG family RNA polymerase sigma factor [Oscillospiraceae bacterium]